MASFRCLLIFKILVGDYMEIGEFQSVRARHGTTKTTSIMPQVYNEPESTTNSNCIHVPTMQNSQIAKQIVDYIMSGVQTSIEKAIHLAQQMPVDYSHEQTM